MYCSCLNHIFSYFKIPGEGFVAAARHNEQVTKTALKAFKEKMLMFPMPMRQYLWEDYIYSSKGQKKPKVRQIVMIVYLWGK